MGFEGRRESSCWQHTTRRGETTADISRFLALAGEPNGGLIVTSGARGILHRDLIIALAARHQLPTIYGYRTPS
jgi:hypothetical protein